MNPLDELTQLFSEFPGIGPRQARRFVHHLLHQSQKNSQQLAQAIERLHTLMTQCTHCFTFYKRDANTTPSPLCEVCRSENTDKGSMLILSTDPDLDAVKKSHMYTGRYFILGGTTPILHSKKQNSQIRSKELFNEVKRAIKEEGLHEIIFAFACNPDGEHTEMHVRTILSPIVDAGHITVSTLGRGLSTGTELEYIDETTLRNALESRK